ncbi:MAG: YHYH protein [Reichenbachiella sp.]|uniref:YHYH protein n=1 Tax=Reichenbachiella sp. TaxID=2184521 RepID=UPI003299946A
MMKGKEKLITALLFMIVAFVFVRCTEDDPTDGSDTDLDINVILEATQDGAEGGDDVIFAVSLVDSDGTTIKNNTGADLTASVAITGTADEDDFDTDFFNTISIADGQSGGSITLEVADDAEVEGEETITLTLSALSLGDIDNASATAKISDNDEDEEETTGPDISVLADLFYHTDAVTFSFDDEWVTITSKDLPDHKSMYYDEDEDLYEDYDEPNNDDFNKNPGSIQEQNLVFKVPRYPTEASNKESTPMGPMGVTINSVALFNQNAAGDDDIFDELNTFDQYEGHPAGETYHYHTEPVWLTQHKENADNEGLVGILLDGFPVYGTHEDGEEVLSKDDGGILDDYHGHFGETADFPDGIYHYHITVEYPWINEDGFYGTAGTVTD